MAIEKKYDGRKPTNLKFHTNLTELLATGIHDNNFLSRYNNTILMDRTNNHETETQVQFAVVTDFS